MAANRIPPSQLTLDERLAEAVTENNIDLARHLLINLNANPSGVDSEEVSHLASAIMLGHAKIVELLLSRGADQTILCKKNQIGLIRLAGTLCRWDCVNAFLKYPSKNKVCLDDYSTVLLIIPSKMNNDNQAQLYALAESLFKVGVDTTWCWQFTGQTLLHEGVKYNQVAFIKLLLKNNADPKEKNYSGKSPVELAVTLNQWDCVEAFMKCMAKLEEADIILALSKAATHNWHCVKVILENASEKLKKNSEYFKSLPYVLYRAVNDNLVPAVLALLKAGADPNIKFNHQTVFHLALSKNVEIFTLLKRYGADPSSRNLVGKTQCKRQPENYKTRLI